MDASDPVRAAQEQEPEGLEQAVVEANLALREELEERTKALDAAESRFRAILGATQDGIVVLDRDGSVLFANGAAADMLQMKPRDLTGEHFGLPVAGEEAVLIELVGKDRSLRMVQMQVVETEWEGATAHLATLHDVTAMKGAEELLRQAVRRLEEVNDLKNEFVGMVVHDMRTPLTIISGFAQTLRQSWDSIDEDHKKEILARIEAKAAELARMVSDTLQVSSIESNSFRYDMEAFDLAALARDTKELIAEAANTQARINLSIDGDLPLAYGDRIRQSQILTNLISNAIKYSDAPADVEIAIRRANDELQVTVADRGRGIAKNEINKLFKKFSRLRQAANIPGSGLGLYICKRMIEDQSGRIWVESEVGVGSKFHYTVPIASPSRHWIGDEHQDERS